MEINVKSTHDLHQAYHVYGKQEGTQNRSLGYILSITSVNGIRMCTDGENEREAQCIMGSVQEV